MVGRDALLIAGSLAYRYKTRRKEDAFFDLDSLDYKVTPSTLSKARHCIVLPAAAGRGATPSPLTRCARCHRSSCTVL